MKYKIYCAECKKEYIIEDPEFTGMVMLIEERVSRMASILAKEKVPVFYKNHSHIPSILQNFVVCCSKPELYFCEVVDSDEIDMMIDKRRQTQKATKRRRNNNV